jgi:hypothetical protein
MSSASTTPASPIQVPEIDSDEPVVVIPVASVAPLDGAPDGERINTFALTPRPRRFARGDYAADLQQHVLEKPLASLVAAFALGWLIARVLR